MLRFFELNMALSEKDTSFQISSDLAPSLHNFFTDAVADPETRLPVKIRWKLVHLKGHEMIWEV